MQFILLKLITWFFILLEKTYTYTYHSKCLEKSHILMGWHEYVIAMLCSQRKTPYRALVSRAREGQWVSEVCRKMGYVPIEGSADKHTHKGGFVALFTLMRELKRGASVAITVDGSSGPRRVIKPGIVELAKRTGVPIVPFIAVATKSWQLSTWDQMKIPKPFARIDVYYGDEIVVSPDEPTEDALTRLTHAMNQLEKN